MRTPDRSWGNPSFPLLLVVLWMSPIQLNFWDYTGILRVLITGIIGVILLLIYIATTRKKENRVKH
ncbi:MAG: hypothetical protein ACTSP1_16690 [Candidatus Freyarchaeota archaeon]